MNKKVAILFFLLTMALTAQAEITFSAPELASDHNLLFGITQHNPGKTSYNTLFMSNIEITEEKPLQLTSYPEKMDILNKGEILRVKNRYGVTEYNIEKGTYLASYSNSQNPIPVDAVYSPAESVSPDGKWICTIEKTGPARGSVVLKNIEGFLSVTLVEEVQLSYTTVPVSWSPDSKFLIYQKDGDLYFTEPETAFKTSQIPEKLRKIGTGSINNIAWASSQNLVYIADDLVYSIPIYEMYLRALYSDFVGVGKIIGRLPHNFSKYDNFSVSPDCSSMVLINSQRTISYLELPGKATFVTQRYVGTQIASAGSTQSCTVFWDSKNTPVIWFQYYNTFKYSSEAFKLAESTLPTGRAVIPVALSLPEAVSFPLLSPDGTQLLFKNTSNLYVYDITPWKQSAVLACKDVVSYVWGNNHIFLGNPEAVIRWDYTKVSQNSADVLFPSSAGEYRWNSETGNPVIKNSWGIFEYDSAQTSWIASDISQLPEPSIVNSKYRVYLDTSPYSNYTNAIYIRTLEGLAKTEAFYISQQEKVSTKPQVALALDALDNADGLAYIMQVLEQYQIDGTFFINGEFIRRYPVETLRIAQSSQECASMFYISTDLVSIQDFIIDESFIRRGLARNEDDFYSLTQRELSVLWHTPYYSYNDQIVEAGNQAGYTFVHKAIDTKDTETFDMLHAPASQYIYTDNVIENIINALSPGAVIPIAVGINGERVDYLYQKLELLVIAIQEAGYDIVPVSQLLKAQK